jgi:deazaflavin-dependent oxidoreductase (nitroreductase family)
VPAPGLEQRFFRALNSVVEPAVRHGVFSSRLFPTTMIVLESTGYRSGRTRRTPLFCQHWGPYLLLSTARGRRSFWVRNLQRQPAVRYYLGGRSRPASALVLAPGEQPSLQPLPLPLRTLARTLQRLVDRGWAFALLKRE